MNKDLALKVLGRMKTEDFPFKFEMALCDKCTMAVIEYEKTGAVDKPHVSQTAEMLSIDQEQGHHLFIPGAHSKHCPKLTDISLETAIETFENFINTGVVEWPWEKEGYQPDA